MAEGHTFEYVPAFEPHAVDDANLVAVLQILADPGQLHLYWNAERLQYVAAPDPRQHEKLRRIERAAAEDDLARSLRLSAFPLCGRWLAMSDQRHAGVGVAALDRGARGRRHATADAVAVSGRSLRRSAGGRLDCPRQAVAVAVAPAAAMGRMLAGAAAVARAAARSVLVEAAGVEPQRNALGSGPVRAGCLSLAGAGQRMAAAPRVVPAQCLGRSAGRGRRAGRDPQAVPLSRPAAGAQAGGL